MFIHQLDKVTLSLRLTSWRFSHEPAGYYVENLPEFHECFSDYLPMFIRFIPAFPTSSSAYFRGVFPRTFHPCVRPFNALDKPFHNTTCINKQHRQREINLTTEQKSKQLTQFIRNAYKF